MTKFRSIRIVRLLVTLEFCFALAGCGGGGSTTGVSNAPTGTTITGTVAKGVFTSGIVECYFVTGSTKGPLYKTAVIGPEGTYSLDIGANKGLVVLEAYGKYTDESTLSERVIVKGVDRPLRTALNINGPTGNVKTAVTPLTELALRYAYARSRISPPELTQTNVEAANSLVSDIFTFDILATQPVQPSASALSSATDAQKRQAMILSGLSTLAPSPTKIDTLLTGYAGDLSIPPNRISETNNTALLHAINTFLDPANTNNNTGYSYAQAQQIALFPDRKSVV